MALVEIVFWLCAGLLVYTHLGYPLVLALLDRLRPQPRNRGADASLPRVSLIVAAHDEEEVIAAKIANARALDYPRELLELIVASDGSSDRTVELAEAAGVDLALDLDRSGKIGAQNAAVARASGEVLAFSDANATWAPGAMRELLAPFADAGVAYVCGQVCFSEQGGSNQEGAYWRYEMAIRKLESRLGGVTAGNGAIYAVRAEDYMPLHGAASHDLSFPFMLAKRGRRAVYAPAAVAEEKMVASTEGEFARKRRMMRGIFDEVIRDGMLSPRGYRPIYAFEIASHRALRYLSPFLHLVALAANIALVGESPVYVATLAIQAGLLISAALAGAIPARPLRLARYYVLVTASIAAGLWDRVRLGTPGAWEKAEGTR